MARGAIEGSPGENTRERGAAEMGGKARSVILDKLKEAATAVLPVAGIVLAMQLLAPMPGRMLTSFLLGTIPVTLGMALFAMGADMAMIHMGELIGAELSRRRSAVLIALAGAALGFVATVAEPDLTVLAKQVPNIDTGVLILAVAAGVGVLLALALLRIVWRRPLNRLLAGLYIPLFLLAAAVARRAPEYVAVAFDSGGVTTGPITVPFILALGLGVSAVRGGRSSQSDSFGLVALGSIGPILSVLILGLAQGPGGEILAVRAETGQGFFASLPVYLREVLVALAPILAVFAVFQAFVLRLPRRRLGRVCAGLLYTYLGLSLFLAGVNALFMPAGSYMGGAIAQGKWRWALVPIGMLMGYFIVAAEPAVQVLNEQVETVTGGAVTRKAMMAALSAGVSVSVGLALLRVLTHWSIWAFLLPGYVLALGLAFFVPDHFTAIAFDSGGVASGPMTATFLLPFAMGACEGLGGNVLTDAFGVVAMVAMTPLITIQLMGLYVAVSQKRAERAEEALAPLDDYEIIEF